MIIENITNYIIFWEYQNTKSKSVYDYEEKNNLSICNMVAYKARKALYEKVQVRATLIGCNLWISQGRMCRKKIYNASW